MRSEAALAQSLCATFDPPLVKIVYRKVTADAASAAGLRVAGKELQKAADVFRVANGLQRPRRSTAGSKGIASPLPVDLLRPVSEVPALQESGGPTQADRGHAADLVLVCMPFFDVTSPAIGLSLLKQVVAPLGVSAEILYLNLLLARRVGTPAFGCIENVGYDCLAGEWVFAEAAFPTHPTGDTGYIQSILRGRTSAFGDPVKPVPWRSIRTIRRVRRAVLAFLEESVDLVMRRRPRIVGFSSVFQQQTACLALARRLKERSPEIFVVFGGANCEGPMGREIVRQFSFVDAVVSGEGETVFPEVVRRVLGDLPLSGLQGVYVRHEGGAPEPKERCRNAPVCREMDSLPFPLYDDYFEQFEATGIALPDVPRKIPLETSRGCWWGEKSRCAFCGLNDQGMAYRCKSSRRAEEELRWMSRRYDVGLVEMTDNVMSKTYLEDFLPALASRPIGVPIFYQTRAKLQKAEVRALRNAGVLWVQPGIESLSSPALKLMRKGVTAMQNIQFLKWCKQFGILPLWNLLAGFPGEDPEAYARMARLIPLIVHLQPPVSVRRIRLDRFSPHFKHAAAFGFADVTPLPAYRHIYPLTREALTNVAYHFSYSYRSPREVEAYLKPVRDQVRRWLRHHKASALVQLDDGRKLAIWDQRPVARELFTVLTGIQRTLYLACDSFKNLSHLHREVASSSRRKPSRKEVEEQLVSLLDRCLMIREGDNFLSLAIPWGE